MANNPLIESRSAFDSLRAGAGAAVLFTARWCGMCRRVKPVFAKLAEELAGRVACGTLALDGELEDMAMELNVSALPTVLFLANGEVVDRFVGSNVGRLGEKLQGFAAAKTAAADGAGEPQDQDPAEGAQPDRKRVREDIGETNSAAGTVPTAAAAPDAPTAARELDAAACDALRASARQSLVAATTVAAWPSIGPRGRSLSPEDWTLVDRCLLSAPGATLADAESLLRFRVPRLTADGTCSAAEHDLDPVPFDLGEMLGIPTAEEARAVHPEMLRVWRLRQVVATIQAATGAEWVGVYEVRPVPASARGMPADAAPAADAQGMVPTLVKLAYVGSPSRAFFPVTEALASRSSNSRVALRQRASVIPDTHAMAADTPYYVCDGRVRFEVCAPIVGPDGRTAGIVDLEAWHPHALSDHGVALVLQACRRLGALAMGRA